MTLEWILTLVIMMTTVMGVFFSESNSLSAVFRSGGQKLGARLEKQIETGAGFRSIADGGQGQSTQGVGWSEQMRYGRPKPIQ